MSAPPAERLSFEVLLWISACLALTLLPDVATRPIWVTVTVVAAAALRLSAAARGRDPPPRGIRLLIAALAIGILFLQFRTFNGLAAGTALLSLIAGLKLLETRTRRDLHVITMIIYFLSLATLLEGESFWLLSYLIGVCWLTTSTLLRLTSGARGLDWRGSIRPAARLLAQALPLAVVFWLFFPRFNGPLWQMQGSDQTATSGLSDSMSPGDITELAQSDDVAFRVRFVAPAATGAAVRAGAAGGASAAAAAGTGATADAAAGPGSGAGAPAAGAPPPGQRYWRGPVLHDFDGRAWRRTDGGAVRAPRLLFRGPAYRYTVSLEPTQHKWIFVLDWPAAWNAPNAFLTSDYMLVEPTAATQPSDVTATSYTEVQAAEPLSDGMRQRDTRLPPGRNPRSLRLAQELRSAHPDDSGYIAAVLAMFHSQPYYYTLTPPRLAEDSVDGFLFDTKRGFCGHYASAFAALMRAAGIPARVVTGYQGGTFNRYADYWILRQSDAHAWDEVWIEGRGWVRIDPTSVIAPERVEHGLNDLVTAGAQLESRWQQRTPWLTDTRLRLDALRLLWRERILRFNPESQDRLLAFLRVPDPDAQKLVLVLAISLILGMSWLTWQVRRDLAVGPRDPVTRAYQRLCRRLGRAGLPRMPSEGAEAFAARVGALRPELAATLRALCRRYSDLRYGEPPRKGERPREGEPLGPANDPRAASFIAGVRAFRPGRARPSRTPPGRTPPGRARPD
jgi:transglutaminase-like putative cysteine protease